MELSVVIPAYNEERNVTIVHKHLSSVLKPLNKAYELIFVNDGSTDNTLSELKKLRKLDKKVKVISFTKNFKKASALAAGLKRASGEVVITMDADMQDSPSEIPNLLRRVDQGYDMVIGWKYPRKDPLHKIVASKIFNLLVRILTRSKIHDCDSNFRVMKKEVIPHLELYSGLYRYIPVIAHQKGFKIGEVKVKHQPRVYGKSKYPMTRLFTGFFDLVTIKFLLEYNKRPLHFFGGIGSIFLLLGIITGTYLLYLKFFINQLIGQRPLLILTILLVFLGMQFISIGLIGEMIANINQKKKDEYVVKEKYGFD
ncbi:glycosyltransferase family 2 protein [Candidatus Woesearchaeota archaeon]|nr:glycosyltransferase family 2 protein [Candidatus Woesearchaeota archaeon]